jgi:hypothetical protein
MAAFATTANLVARWRPLSVAETAQASVLLDDASATVRAEYPGVDAAIVAGTLDAGIPLLVVCGMVKRAMIASETGEGVQSQSETAGPFAHSQTYANPMGNVYLTKQDRRLLGYGGQRAFMIDTAPSNAGAAFTSDGYSGWC